MDMYWIEEIRTDFLTNFFFIFPFFTSSYFYVSCIAIGYWLRPGGKTFNYLGFLVPFATVIAIILKNSFQILRPPVDLQLVMVENSYGFPSADVLVAVVFWGMLLHRSKHFWTKLIPIFFILGIALSRIYLGVHSVTDSVAGFCLGALLLVFWYREDVQAEVNGWFSYDTKSFWGIYLLCFVTYLISYDNDLYIEEVAVSLGALLGYGLSIVSMRKWEEFSESYSIAHFRAVILCYAMLLMAMYTLPLIETNELSMFISTILEYSILAVLIFAVFPKIIANEIDKYSIQKSSNVEHDPGHDIVVNYKSLTR